MMASAQTWGQDEHRLLSALFPYLDKEPQEVLKAWGILRDQRRALLTCLTDLLTEPDYFLQAADTIVLVHPDCVPSDQEWVIGRLRAIRRDCLYSQTRQTIVEIFIRLSVAQ